MAPHAVPRAGDRDFQSLAARPFQERGKLALGIPDVGLDADDFSDQRAIQPADIIDKTSRDSFNDSDVAPGGRHKMKERPRNQGAESDECATTRQTNAPPALASCIGHRQWYYWFRSRQRIIHACDCIGGCAEAVR